MSHAKDLAIWSNKSINPYPNLGFLGLIPLFVENLLSHFTGTFLFNRGDVNIRGSIQTVGMLSAIDKLAIVCLPVSLGIFWCKKIFVKNAEVFFTRDQWGLFTISILGIVVSIIPAALTVEGNPHALRAIGAWPFFAALTGLLLYQIGNLTYPKGFAFITACIGVIFFTQYLYKYYIEYPRIAKESFRINNNPGIDYAYSKIAHGDLTCKEAKNAPYEAVINQSFNFSNSSAFLRNGWHTPENWGVWSNSKSSFLLVPMPSGNPEQITFLISAFLSPKFPTQELEVWINKKLTGQKRFTDQDKRLVAIPLDASLRQGENLSIEFRIKQLRNPKESGISDDIRPLGIALYSGEFQSPSQKLK
jgi:hypothetical protein